MKRIILVFAFAMPFLCELSCGQVPPVGTAGDSTSRPEFEALATDYQAQEKAIDAELDPQMKAAQERYRTGLEAIAQNYHQTKRPVEADAVRNEAKLFASRGLKGEPPKTVPPEVRPLWGSYSRTATQVTQSVALKRSSARTKFLQSLVQIERAYISKNDASGVAMAKQARVAVTLRNAIEANQIVTTEGPGGGGDVSVDICEEGGYIVGFEAGQGRWRKYTVLGGLKPIYATVKGTRDGASRGKSVGQKVMAKDGYAVGGMLVCRVGVVDCIQIIFMRINPDGISLNSKDFYVSDWLGNDGGGKPVEINSRGRMIVGISGHSDGVVESICLIHTK